MNILPCAPSLRALRLDFDGHAAKRLEEPLSGPIPLSKLLSLTLSWTEARDDRAGYFLSVASRISQSLRVPALRSFHLRFQYDGLSRFSPDKGVRFFPVDLSTDSVRELSFSITGSLEEHVVTIYGCCFSEIDHLCAEETELLDPIQSQVEQFIVSFVSQFPSATNFNLRASRFTENISNLDALLELRELHVYGAYEALSFLPKIVRVLEQCESSNLREVFLHVRHDLREVFLRVWDLDDLYYKKDQRGCNPGCIARLISEQLFGRTVISVIETTSADAGDDGASDFSDYEG